MSANWPKIQDIVFENPADCLLSLSPPPLLVAMLRPSWNLETVKKFRKGKECDLDCLGMRIAWAKLCPSVPPCWRIVPGKHLDPNLSSINHQLACFIITVVDHPPKSIESLSDGCVYVGPHVLWQEVLVLWEVGCQVPLPGVKVAVESSVRDHGWGNVGVRTWGNWNHVGSPGVSQVTLLRA